MINVLVIGSGGREHALVWKLRQSPRVAQLWCAPGNPGIRPLAECVPLQATDLRGLLRFAQASHVDLTVVGPEQPLAAGIVDLFEDHGMCIFGPTRRAAELEWSKVFAKEFMARHAIPTAPFHVFDARSLDGARQYLRECPLPVVLKADGLAAGKGVVVAGDRDEALNALEDMATRRVFGDAGSRVVVEGFLRGEEASVFAVCDGTDALVLAPAQDHKRVGDGDRGKNTGGMGAYAPAPVMTPGLFSRVVEEIIRPTLRGMQAEGRPYRGCLYVGLMITGQGPRVVEYNARFGDPETQVVLPLFDGDLAALLLAAASGSLPPDDGTTRCPSGSAVCVVLASGGYPDAYVSGFPISGIGEAEAHEGIAVFHAGTREEAGSVVTAGGRVLGVTAFSPQESLRETITSCYAAAQQIHFERVHFRRDIGAKALQRGEEPSRPEEQRS